MMPPALPRAARPFVTFGTLLRRNDFLVAPEQIATFLSAVNLLGPSSMADIRRAAHATLAPHPERRADFNALFDAHFLGETVTALEQVEAEDDEIRVQEDRRGSFDPLVSDDINEAGEEATAVEVLSVRRFSARERSRNPAPLRARDADACSAPARLSHADGQTRRRRRFPPYLARGDPQ